ncbi:OmpA family protein [Flavobacterium sp.]|uniref:OmpA family protein n=1 Tax=Flavobacterium sp. TaxID=239 RepID=UPI001B7871F4|nr:OmpA family protein [Flavobacterium sp.]MBP6128239.1 OmpA family protein [Flavobacterium sp.]
MKNIYILAGALLLSTASIQAQNKDTKEADNLFDRLEYVDAAKAYTKLVEKNKADGYVYKQLADSYYNVFNSQQAVVWYAKAVESTQDAETHFRYAQMLKAEGDNRLAAQQMAAFAKMQPSDARAKAFTSNPEYTNQLKNQAKQYEVLKSDVSSDKTDFGAVLSQNNELYFTSARNTSRKENGMDDQPYLDLYKAIRNTDGTLSQATAVEELNTKWHDGPATITSDGTTMYYGSESFNESAYQKNKEKHLKFSQIYLYKATKIEGDKWGNAKALPINSKDYSVRNPSISKDGKTLYFSSNMPGGFGGEDIWKVSVDGDTYGTPENAGANINTEGNESFPSIQDDGILFFSSNGKQGFGGYDVFKQNTNTKEQAATNLGAPVNTQKDDFSFSYNLDKNVGYFSSNREGNDDIYQAIAVCGVDATVVVKDAETGKLLSGASVTFVDQKGKNKGNQESNDMGEAKFGVACDEIANFNATRAGYQNGTATMAKSKNGAQNIVINLTPIQPIITETEVILQPIYFEYNQSNITAQGAEELDKLVKVMNQYPTMVIDAKSHTDSRGSDSFNLKLSDRRAKATVQYIVSKGISKERITGTGMGETQPKAPCTECTEEQHAQNRRSEFLLIKK